MIEPISALIGRYPAGSAAHEHMAYALVAVYERDWIGCRAALVCARNAVPAPYTKTAIEQINPIIEGVDRASAAALGRVA